MIMPANIKMTLVVQKLKQPTYRLEKIFEYADYLDVS